MTPTPLIPPPDPSGLPLPAAALLILKTAGFFLHAIFMTLWLAGMPAAAALSKVRPAVSARLFRVMPFALAFGINAGIVPLLFLQTLYPQFFFPATILQAWPWLFVIPLVLAAYTAAYLASYGIRPAAAGGGAAILLAWVGVTFASSMTLLAAPDRWGGILAATSGSGAVHGLYLHLGAESLLRFGMALGLACGTLAAFLAIDARSPAREAAYRTEARPLVPLFALLGLAVYGACGALYVSKAADHIPAVWIAASAAGLPLAAASALVYGRRQCRGSAVSLAVLQAAALLVNAVARQVEQTGRLERHAASGAEIVRTDWGSFGLFVLILAAGTAVLAWLGRAIARALHESAPPPTAPNAG
jgi:hypothetical protein